jgi:CheY-like chemotaxis protein
MTDILIVSNQQSTRIAYTAALNGYGYAVMEAHSIQEAQAMLRSGMQPRAIVLDIKYTPAMRDAFNEFETLYYGRPRPALVIVGSSENAHLAESIADVFLPRPAQIYDLITGVQACLS